MKGVKITGSDAHCGACTPTRGDVGGLLPERSRSAAKGTDGRTWARLSHGLTRAERWVVHQEDGSLEGTLVLPDGVRLMDVGPDWGLGMFTDALGVAYVGMWRLP